MIATRIGFHLLWQGLLYTEATRVSDLLALLSYLLVPSCLRVLRVGLVFWPCCIARWSYELFAFAIANLDQQRSTFQDLNLVSILGVTRLKPHCWTEGLLF